MRLDVFRRMRLDVFRRSYRFCRKVKLAGLRIVCTGTMPVGDIRMLAPNQWLADRLAGTDHTIYHMPHYALLVEACRRAEEKEGVWDLPQTAYWQWQVSLRGVDGHPRPDEWIAAMALRLLRLYASIRTEGYRQECVADRIAVLPMGTLWDGGHRLACLAHLGWMAVPVVRVEAR